MYPASLQETLFSTTLLGAIAWITNLVFATKVLVSATANRQLDGTSRLLWLVWILAVPFLGTFG